jgi:hypothetical protein
MTQDTLSVGQLVFARVEPEYSPNNTSGFQFVYRTAELQPTQLEQIKQHVQCFQPYEPDTTRRQFFRLRDGLIVLSHSRVIAPWPGFQTVVDKKGRTGAFFAHCLVLTADNLRAAGGDPLAILTSNIFIEDMPTMIEYFGSAAEFERRHNRPNGIVSPARLAVLREAPLRQTGWEGDAGRSLLALAMQAEILIRQGKSVALIGSQAEIWAALQTALALVPFEQRLQCSFDTCIDRCVITPAQYWGVGVKERPGSANYIDVNATQRRVPVPVSLAAASDDLYGLWLQDVTLHGGLDEAVSYARTIQLISRAFSRQNPLPREAAQDSPACIEFLRVHQIRVDQIISDTLIGDLGSPVLANLVADRTMVALSNPVERLSVASTRKFPPNWLVQILYDLLLERNVDLKEADWTQLQEVARRERHHSLLFAAATLGKRPDPKLANLAVSSMEAGAFRKLLSNLGESVAPSFFVDRIHAQELADYLVRNNVQLDAVRTLELFEALVRTGQATRLTSLIGYLDVLDQSGRRRIQKLLAQQPAPEAFRRALEEAIDEESSPNLLDRLFRRNQRRS